MDKSYGEHNWKRLWLDAVAVITENLDVAADEIMDVSVLEPKLCSFFSVDKRLMVYIV